MELFNSNALVECIRDAIRSELKSISKEQNNTSYTPQKEESLLTKKEMAEELDISLVTLTDWMKKGLPYQRLHSRIYFRKEDVFSSMKKFSK
ncbi:helix-turn-helix domain-containing protein [Zobellia barbeyronii]|uniref:Helix-turn-helix domain-containing protein n=1 Tax=Zobellia barbeyronii TaxID=2748009 RepID=A0ABS5WEC8_9FLAO|nr:helix-turn-helix domain-containing protein [Zobellia barbeyronii]MBT2161291.1 helix-turn-helix domain-containing protein [Zobellia barbeyronii]